MDKLERQNAGMRRILEAESSLASLIGRFSALVALGPSLTSAIQGWMAARQHKDRSPVAETATLVAAVVRRVLRVGLVSALLAVAPIALLVWQNTLLQRQLGEQAQRNSRAVSVENLRGTYDTTLAYPLRHRMVAEVLADREGVDLTRLVAKDFLFERLAFDRANLTGADLRGAEFRFCTMESVRVSSALLDSVVLSGSVAQLDNSNARFPRGVRLTATDARGSALVLRGGGRIVGCDLRDSNVHFYSDSTLTVVDAVDFRGSHVSVQKGCNVVFRYCHFGGAQLVWTGDTVTYECFYDQSTERKPSDRSVGGGESILANSLEGRFLVRRYVRDEEGGAARLFEEFHGLEPARRLEQVRVLSWFMASLATCVENDGAIEHGVQLSGVWRGEAGVIDVVRVHNPMPIEEFLVPLDEATSTEGGARGSP
ncbi:MAG: hypothetical protein DHS20C21_01690 [Gemmatimonadota bacterium]|nr:MAG: hypothetical protein DHS20C21_01690 [Gemmatimonadota bacterium]